MKTRIRVPATLAMVAMLALLAVFTRPAAAQTPQALELADRLFERAGLVVQLQPLAGQFQEGLGQNRGELPQDVLEALADAGRTSFAVPALRAEIVPLLARQLPTADMKEVLAWLDRPLGRRVTHAEEIAAGAMTQEAMQAYLEREKHKPASPARAGLIADLAAATNAVEIAASSIEAMSLGIAVGMDAVQPAEKRIGVAVLRERLRALMPPEKLRANMAASIPVMYGFTYRDIAEPELVAYVGFNQSPLGRRYNKAVNDALARALTHASVRIGELVQSRPDRKQI